MTSGLVARFQSARRDPALVVLEGFHALKHALRFDAVVDVALSPEPSVVCALAHALAPDLVERLEALVTRCDAARFAELAPTPPETGVIALAARPTAAAGDVRYTARPLVVLDHPRHPGNLGAAVRVAAAADAAGVAVIGASDPWQPTAVRAAAGLQFALPCFAVASAEAIERPLIGFDAAGEPASVRPLPHSSAFVFGGERHGLTAATRALTDRTVALAMRPGVSSLNLATAVAAALYTLAPPLTPPAGA